MRWWECDEVNLIAANLSGSSLAAFACCKAIRANLRSRDTLRCVDPRDTEIPPTRARACLKWARTVPLACT